MSDANGLTTGSAPETGFGQPAPDPAPAGGPSTPVGTDPLAEPSPDQAVFDRGYVESIRREAQGYRGRMQTAEAAAKAYDDVFGVYEQPDREVWFDLARTWAADPMKAAQVMQQIAQGVLGDGQPDEQQQQPEITPTTPPPPGMSAEDVQRLVEAQLAARDQQVAESRAIQEVYAEVRAAGYDPEGDGFQILYDANHFTGGDIAKAVEMQKAREQKIIDSYVQGRSAGRMPMPTSSNGAPATGLAAPPSNLEEADKATKAYLRELRQNR